jgi:hypothetical protein
VGNRFGCRAALELYGLPLYFLQQYRRWKAKEACCEIEIVPPIFRAFDVVHMVDDSDVQRDRHRV